MVTALQRDFKVVGGVALCVHAVCLFLVHLLLHLLHPSQVLAVVNSLDVDIVFLQQLQGSMPQARCLMQCVHGHGHA